MDMRGKVIPNPIITGRGHSVDVNPRHCTSFFSDDHLFLQRILA